MRRPDLGINEIVDLALAEAELRNQPLKQIPIDPRHF
jgi:hypothetical protein